MRDRDHYRSLIHPLLAVGMPASFLVPACAIIADASRGLAPDILPGLAASVLICLGTGLAAAFFGNVEQDERAQAFARLRELALLLIAVHLGASLFRQGPFVARFLPSARALPPLFLAAVQWLFTTMYQDALRAREFFLERIEGAHGVALRGLSLQNAIRDEATLAAEAIEGLARVRRSAAAFALCLAALWIGATLLGARIGAFAAFSAVPCFFLLPFVNALTNQYRIEHFIAGEGLAGDEGLRARRIRSALILTAAVLIPAILLSADQSLLPPRWIADFFSWLSGLFRFEPRPMEAPPPPPPSDRGMIDLLRALAEAPDAKPALDLRALFAVLRRVSIFAFAAAAAWFLVSPLFSRHFRDAVRRRSFLAFIKRKLAQIARLFRSAGRGEEEAVRMSADELKTVRDNLRAIASRRSGKGKKREIGAMSKLFLRLIEWGSARSVEYGPTTAPGEYASALASAVPALAVDILAAGGIFEEALYSDRPVQAQAAAAYREAIARILAYRPDRE